MTASTARRAVNTLTRAQQAAVVPDANVWLSASAGSGKTQVLSARVIRLLLAGARPGEILCLTFTKAAAAEMAERINRRLASWVQMKAGDLSAELKAIGADYGHEALPSARKLFARILDAEGGGLQIQTIHSFCQSLLASFPEEAGIMPGFEPLDDRTKIELQKDVLAQIAAEADDHGNARVAASLNRLGMDHGEDGAWKFLQRCAAAVESMRALPVDQGVLTAVRRALNLNFDQPVEDVIASLCEDDMFDRRTMIVVKELNEAWGKGKAESRGAIKAAKISGWLGRSPAERAQTFDDIHECWSKKDGDKLTASKGFTPDDPAYDDLASSLYRWSRQIIEQRALAGYADKLADALIAGRAFALRYEATKRSRGLVDFDDLIARAADLLNTGGMTEWVRYKLDRRIDHILVDEAQDTNEKQWEIIEALSGDFFAGAGAKGEKSRTIFAVGDFKQAIYGFQGTDPAKYRDAGLHYTALLEDQDHRLENLTLSQSFRSTQPILRLVNTLIETRGHERFGLQDAIATHVSDKPDTGSIELIEAVTAASAAESDDIDDDEEKWLGPEKRELAALLAQRIKALVDEKPVLATTGKPLTPGNIMVLFRKRTEVAALLVARLHALKVPVAGIDRMRIEEQLAVQDLVAAIRFASQPLDDLSLACLLVSPLVGWTQERLLEHGYRPAGVPLWRHLRLNDAIAADLAPLRDMLASADFTTPYQFLEQILSGPHQGRRKLTSRLGAEALVPIEEFLNLAIEFESSKGGTLQQFLDWFERNSSEIKRERLTGSDEVQIMTVHGAKGLQAPVVILADATVDPSLSGKRDAGMLPTGIGSDVIPMLPVNKDRRVGRLAEIEEARETRDLDEHYRLLYVALTRAEERLIIAGSLGSKQPFAKPESWYCAIDQAMEIIGQDWQTDASERKRRLLRGADTPTTVTARKTDDDAHPSSHLPDWLGRPAMPEVRPSRPLAPSRIEDHERGERPPEAMLRHAAERGKLIHGLIERINGDNVDAIEKSAARWLSARDPGGIHDHSAIIAQIKKLVSDPRWQRLFSADARAEVPIAAVVGDTVIAGRIDRLIVTDTDVQIVDFKTSRTVPRDASEVNRADMRQMAYYVAAMEKIFPDRTISCALLYTHVPIAVELSATDIAPYRPV